ncbi:MAG TPA: DUF4294 domain-containing protein [Paludibacteraceae bacterium]|nr:DUF4294 domain-containing protein [Paludibacteraceae bacterium]
MKRFLVIVLLLCLTYIGLSAQTTILKTATGEIAGYRVPIEISGSDTIYIFTLPNVYIYPTLRFKNKQQEKYYWKLVRDVKKTLPYSKLITKTIQETNDTLMRITNKRERDRYMRKFEKEIYKKNESSFKNMTFSQGKLLIRLIDRECDATSYELIRAYRGSFTAGFYQLFAKIFGADLKAEYGSGKNDALIERIILQVESGQL